MNKIKILFSVLFSLSATTYAQQVTDSINKFAEVKNNISFLDSIKATFKRDTRACRVDSLWLKELTSNDLYDNISSDIKNVNIDENVDFELPTDLLKARLAAMDAKSPFNIEYNTGLENLIKSFLKNRKKSFERLMGVSEYYFPLFEEALSKQNVPLEIKYLAVVESALNANARSRVGATGLWQFMYNTGKQYKLNIDSYVDERSDPLKSSDAAALYMNKMYKIFGDWDLVLASYNSGAGNVSKAIRRSGGHQNFWNIRKFLPRETQGYVPAFLATMYIYEYHKEHGIVPNRAVIKNFATDTVMVKKQISFKQISDLLDMPVTQLQLLNPSYKLDIVPFYATKMHALRLPLDKIATFTSNEDKIYAYVSYEENKREKTILKPVYAKVSEPDSLFVKTKRIVFTAVEKTIHYKVKKGDTITEIAQKHDVTVSEIQKWNHLHNTNVPLGKSLKIITTNKQRVVIEEKKRKPITTAITEVATSEEVKSNPTEEVVVLKEEIKPKATKTVAKSIASKDDSSPKTETNNKSNKLVLTDLKPEYYTVQKGDNLSMISKKYGVTIEELREWNNLEDMNLALDAKLKILRRSSSNLQKELIADAKNSTVYVAESGDNLYFIANKFGVTVADIQKWNNLDGENIYSGAQILILKSDIKPVTTAASKSKNTNKTKEESYLVQKGDSLFTIAQKHPGITVADLKNWNGIKGDELRPGMKLKIRG